jgi:hypothetical protein
VSVLVSVSHRLRCGPSIAHGNGSQRKAITSPHLLLRDLEIFVAGSLGLGPKSSLFHVKNQTSQIDKSEAWPIKAHGGAQAEKSWNFLNFLLAFFGSLQHLGD